MSGANVDNVFDRVETKVKGLLDENAQLREQNRVLREALEFAVRALRSAQPIVCSASCPSVKRTGEEWAHRQPCDSLTLTLRTVESYLPKKAEHVCGARGFGQSLDDQCPGCEHDKQAALTATSQEGQHEAAN